MRFTLRNSLELQPAIYQYFMLSLRFFQRILQNSFTDGVANPCDTESIKNYIVKNNGAVSGYPGSTYLLSQKFEFNWTVIGNMDKVNDLSLHTTGLHQLSVYSNTWWKLILTGGLDFLSLMEKGLDNLHFK